MNIALVNNMNNMFFVFARLLRDAGHDVDLYLLPASEWDPIQDAASADDFNRIGIKTFPFCPFPGNQPSTYYEELIKFRRYDLIIGTGYVISFFRKVGINVDLYVPYGADVDEAYANPGYLTRFFPRHEIEQFMIEHYDTAFSARFVWNNWNRSLTNLGIPYFKGELPNLYLPTLTRLDPAARLADFVVCNPSRQMWATGRDCSPADFELYGGYKRNDIFISGYLTFRKKNPKINAKFVIFNRGDDIGQTIQMFREAGRSDDLIVYEKTSRVKLFSLLKSCDVIGDTFNDGIPNLGFQETSMLASAASRVLITKTSNPDFSSCSHFNTNDPMSIANILNYLYLNRECLNALGELNGNWYRQYYDRASKNLMSLVEYLVVLRRIHARAREQLDLCPSCFSLVEQKDITNQDVARRYRDSLAVEKNENALSGKLES
jgi:hypothetical protein